jgi:predicted KAP-like P-loop ATPase
MSDVDNIQSDQPIVKSSEDRFGRAQFSVRVANVIIGRSDPKSIVVSINGPWGEGKTSMLNMIVEEFDKHSDKVTYIRFNPWRFADETQLLNSFFSLLAEKLSASLQTRPEKASRAIQKYGEALAPITTAASVFTLNIDVAAALRKLASTKASVDL